MKRFILVCGISGSGKSTASKILEDSGFRVVSNLPARLLGDLAHEPVNDDEFVHRTAIFPELGSQESVANLIEELDRLSKSSIEINTIFLDATTEILLNRYKESRRPHPLRVGNSILESIQFERSLLTPIRSISQQILYTDAFDLGQMRTALLKSIGTSLQRKLSVSFMSFGFKYGVPPEIDLCFDARFLPNPYFVDDLREMKGSDQPIQDFVLEKLETKLFLEHLESMLRFLLPLYLKEGKSYLTVGIGCTGGRHRSVVIVDELFRRLQNDEVAASSMHRDINRKVST